MSKYNQDDEERHGGPVDWAWGEGIGALLLSTGLVGFGVFVGLSLACY